MAKMKKISKIRLTILVIVIASIFITLFDFPQITTWVNQKAGLEISLFDKLPFRMGLDLMGGTHLVYEADVTKIASADRNEAVEGVRDVIEKRINAFGVAEPLVQINKGQGKWRVIVEMAGIKDVKEAIKMIGATPLLEFKEQNNEPARTMTAQEKADLAKYNSDAKLKAGKALTAVVTGTDFATVVKEYSEDETGRDNGGDLGWIGSTGANSTLFDESAKTEIGKIYSQVIEGTDGFHVIKVNEKRDDGVEVQASHILICFTGATSCDKTTTKEDAKKLIDELKTKATPANFATLAKDNSTEPAAKTSGGELGWFSKGMMVSSFENAAFSLAKGSISDVIETDFGYHIIYKTDERPKSEYRISQVFVNTKTEADVLPSPDAWKTTGLTGSQLKNSKVEFDQNNIPQVAIEFNDEGKQLFADITTRNVGKPVAIFLDGQPLSTPTVNEAIKDGKAVITGSFDAIEARDLARSLNSGALPVPIELITQQTVGASLGTASLQNSLIAVLIGYLFVILFMIGYYRLPGLLASLALLIYGVIVLFIFKAIPVTLTLSGLAGFILSVGMAVDANVLIFERFKEELKAGKPLEAATLEGFKRAWPSIRDGNFTTLITCFILMFFGTGMIKGFAITLSIGILVSMFSAIVITRTFMLPLTRAEKKYKSLWIFGINKSKTEESDK